MGRLEAALKKLEHVDKVVVDLEQQLCVLRPRLEAAELEVQRKMELITAAKERYCVNNSNMCVIIMSYELLYSSQDIWRQTGAARLRKKPSSLRPPM